MHVIVLAYGPTRLATRAVARARHLAGDNRSVYVVPASSTGCEAARGIKDAATANTIGGAGLRETLSRLGNDPTLLLHDDVVITRRSVAALRDALDWGAPYAVPNTNDPGTDHFIGSLPAGEIAEESLDSVPVPADTRPVSLVRPACVAAAADGLLRLLSEPLADPYASIASTEHGFVAVGETVASHSTSCLHQLAEPESAGEPLLVAALLVQEEAENLAACLESVDDVCDRVEVGNLGASDETLEIARSFGAGIIEPHPGCDPGTVNSQILDRCRDSRYVLWLHPNERLVCPNPEETRRYLATYSSEHPGFNLQITGHDAGGIERSRLVEIRLFRASDPTPLQGHRLDQMSINYRTNTQGGLAYLDRLVAGYAADGQAERAADTAFELLRDAPDGFRHWPELVASLNDHFGGASFERLIPLALNDTTGGFLEPIIKTYPSGTVADFCATYIAAGGRIAEAIRVGLLAAALSSNDRAFMAISPAAANLDPFARIGLADRIAGSGRPDLADTLRGDPAIIKL